jgi:hypothetical protein
VEANLTEKKWTPAAGASWRICQNGDNAGQKYWYIPSEADPTKYSYFAWDDAQLRKDSWAKGRRTQAARKEQKSVPTLTATPSMDLSSINIITQQLNTHADSIVAQVGTEVRLVQSDLIEGVQDLLKKQNTEIRRMLNDTRKKINKDVHTVIQDILDDKQPLSEDDDFVVPDVLSPEDLDEHETDGLSAEEVKLLGPTIPAKKRKAPPAKKTPPAKKAKKTTKTPPPAPKKKKSQPKITSVDEVPTLHQPLMDRIEAVENDNMDKSTM